jgi:protein-disulfide isomerase
MAFLSPESQTAAEASECAAEQDKFWEYHEVLFENQASFSDANLRAFAQEIGLDTQAFNECLDAGRHRETVTTDTARARSLGVSSTPAFLINGQPMLGAQGFEAFQQVIELKLAETGR